MADQAKKLPSKGSLERTPFAKLLRAIAKENADGALYLLKDDTKKVVFIEKGTPVFVRSNVLSECLGQVLAHEGLITQEQCDQTLEAIRRTGKKQGELLVEMGILSAGNLRYGLEAQLRRKLNDIFTWTNGRFQFKAGPTNLEAGLRLDLDPIALIVSGVLETADAEMAAAALDPVRDRFPVARELPQVSAELEADEDFFFCSLDGSRTVDEVLEQAANDGVADSVVLYALIAGGAVQVSRIPRALDMPPATPPADHTRRPDAEFAASYDASTAIREFEDTPLPGALPQRASVTDNVDDDFASVTSEDSDIVSMDEVVNQEPAAIEQTFDEDIEVLDDGELEVIDDEDLEAYDSGSGHIDAVLEGGQDGQGQTAETGTDDDLALDEIDEIDDDLLMSGDDDLVPLDELDEIPIGDTDGDDDADVRGALRYSEGEAALLSGDYAAASAALDEAYECGIDIAELHAMLAYARFCESGGSSEMASHAMELLDYAESINPHLDIVFAYRAAVHLGQGEDEAARTAATHALSLNDYCDVALQVMDQLG